MIYICRSSSILIMQMNFFYFPVLVNQQTDLFEWQSHQAIFTAWRHNFTHVFGIRERDVFRFLDSDELSKRKVLNFVIAPR